MLAHLHDPPPRRRTRRRVARLQPRARPRAGQGTRRTATRRRATSAARRWPPPRGARSPRRSARWRAAPRRRRSGARSSCGRARCRRRRAPRSSELPPVQDLPRAQAAALAAAGRWRACSPRARSRVAVDPGRRQRPAARLAGDRERGRAARALVRGRLRGRGRRAHLARCSPPTRSGCSRATARAGARRSSPPTAASSRENQITNFDLSELEATGGPVGPRDRALPHRLDDRHDDLERHPRARPAADHADRRPCRTELGSALALREQRDGGAAVDELGPRPVRSRRRGRRPPSTRSSQLPPCSSARLEAELARAPSAACVDLLADEPRDLLAGCRALTRTASVAGRRPGEVAVMSITLPPGSSATSAANSPAVDLGVLARRRARRRRGRDRPAHLARASSRTEPPSSGRLELEPHARVGGGPRRLAAGGQRRGPRRGSGPGNAPLSMLLRAASRRTCVWSRWRRDRDARAGRARAGEAEARESCRSPSCTAARDAPAPLRLTRDLDAGALGRGHGPADAGAALRAGDRGAKGTLGLGATGSRSAWASGSRQAGGDTDGEGEAEAVAVRGRRSATARGARRRPRRPIHCRLVDPAARTGSGRRAGTCSRPSSPACRSRCRPGRRVAGPARPLGQRDVVRAGAGRVAERRRAPAGCDR